MAYRCKGKDDSYLITVDEFERWCNRRKLPFRMTLVDDMREFAKTRGEPLPPLPNRPDTREVKNANRR